MRVAWHEVPGKRYQHVPSRRERYDRSATVFDALDGEQDRLLAVWCGYWQGTRRLQRSFEQKAAKVSKAIVLRRS
jgi:hypothetical protein